MQIPVDIGTHKFPSITAARERCREILHGYKYGQPITSETGDTFLRALFARHPAASEKLAGSEVDHFVVKTNRKGTRSFFIIKRDGTTDDFSLNKCLW